MWWIWNFFKIYQSFGSFHLFYLLKAHMKLNGQRWLDEIEQINSRKNQRFLALNDKWVFFICWLLIPEHILWPDISLIRLDVFFPFSIDFLVYWDTPVKYVNKFLVLTNIYIYIYIYIYIISFEFIKVSIIGTFWFLLGSWCS